MKIKIVVRALLIIYSCLVSAGVASQTADNSVTVSGTVYSYSNRLAGIDVSLASDLIDGIVTTRTDEKGHYSLAIPSQLLENGSVNLEFEAVDSGGKYKSLKFVAIIYSDKTDGYDLHMDPIK